MITHIAALEICTKIQYNEAMHRELVLDIKRVQDEIVRLSKTLGHEVRLPELAEMAGLDYYTLYAAVTNKVTKRKKPTGETPENQNRRVSADLVARLAMAFGCSSEFLMGVTDKREPITLNLNEFLDALVKTAKTLPVSRQRDLLLIARAYADAKEESARMAFQEIRTMIATVADETGHGAELDALLKLLDQAEQRWSSGTITGSLGKDASKPGE